MNAIELNSDERVIYASPGGLRVTNLRILAPTQTVTVASLGRVWSETHAAAKVPWLPVGLFALVLGVGLLLVPIASICSLVIVPMGIAAVVIGLKNKPPRPTRYRVLATCQGNSLVLLETTDPQVAAATATAVSSVVGSAM